uniref:Tc1-like transposase DDE domain-containing protein n=1 Tax=Timema bartmani TaxID=61472 RepID=A0A7R9EW93_9NEOP|nr:unnamed protein product [Timema bartmani]
MAECEVMVITRKKVRPSKAIKLDGVKRTAERVVLKVCKRPDMEKINECHFELFPRHKVRVRRTKTQKFLLACVAPAVQQGGNAIILWGCITLEAPGDCKVVNDAMNSDNYCETMIPSAHRLLEDIELLPWPPRSSDLNPIENPWNTMAYRLVKQKLESGSPKPIATSDT